MYRAYGKTDQAIALGEHVRASRVLVLGARHPETLTTLDDLGLAYQNAGQLDKALPLFQQVVAGLEKMNYAQAEAESWVRNLCECHERLNQYDQAEVWRRKWLAVVKAKEGPGSAAYAKELAGLASNLLRQKKYADAEPFLREGLAIRQVRQPAAETTFHTQSQLGGVLLAQQKYAEAEPLLRAGYRGLKERAAKLPAEGQARLREAVDRLIELADAQGDTEAAEKWRKEREAMPP
jgi:tetratricopeptide (TPR) repeat protein